LIGEMFAYRRRTGEIELRFTRRTSCYLFGSNAPFAEASEDFGDMLMRKRDGHRVARANIARQRS
jgi:hypothetical protein